MEFTYAAYASLVRLIRDCGYEFANYHDYAGAGRPCIMRHDVDNSLERALEFARLEAGLPGGGVASTYFVLLTSDFYNVFSARSRRLLAGILDCGHEIGLHFDETAYANGGDVCGRIEEEARLLGRAIGREVRAVSMHRPSPETLAADLQPAGIANSYGERFFREFKYLSDSRMHWREDVEEAVASGRHRALHILTHPFWYSEEAGSARERLMGFVTAANGERYDRLDENFRDLGEFVRREEAV